MENLSYGKNKNLTYFLFLLSLVLAVLALLFKKPEAFTKPQFWAEDGVVFLQEYFHKGIRSIFTPYAGYIHLVPRIGAMLIFHLTSFEYMPAAYNIISLLAFLGIATFIWCRTAFDPYTKFFMTLALSLAPNGCEVVLNITNVQWYLSLFIPLIFLTGYNKKYVFLDGVVLFMVALTGPFSVIFFPLVGAILWYRSRLGKWKNDRWLFFVYLLATVIQLLFILFSDPRNDRNWSIAQKIAHSPQLLYMHVTSPLGIAKIYSEKMSNALFVILLLAMAGWIFLCWRKLNKGKNHIPFFLMLVAIFQVAASVYAIVPVDVQYLNPTTAGARYFFGPCVLFLWSVLTFSFKPDETAEATAKTGETTSHSPGITTKVSWRNLIFLLLFTYYTAVLVLTIPIAQFTDKNWPEQAKKLENFKKGDLEIPINPDNWIIYLHK
jgi:hypothetical protein